MMKTEGAQGGEIHSMHSPRSGTRERSELGLGLEKKRISHKGAKHKGGKRKMGALLYHRAHKDHRGEGKKGSLTTKYRKARKREEERLGEDTSPYRFPGIHAVRRFGTLDWVLG